MKKYDIFISNHHDFDIHTGIATYLSSLVVRSEIGVFHRIVEAMKKNASISSSIGLRAICGETVSKQVNTDHRMALYTTAGTHASKKTAVAHLMSLYVHVRPLYQYLLQSKPVQTILGFQSTLSPVVIRGNYKMSTFVGVAHALADRIYKTIGGANIVSFESGVALCADSGTSFGHNMVINGNIGRVNLIDHVRPKYDVGVSCSVTPLYVSLRTLGDMAGTTLGELQPMTLEEVQIKQTL